jgi:hypothetical protein
MRKAAGIIMLVFGILAMGVSLFILLQWQPGNALRLWVYVPFSILTVAAGIAVLRRRAYWWALLAAIAMIVVATTNAVSAWQDIYRHYDTGARLLMASRFWAIWGIPGLLALIFLMKRKNEFAVSREA